MEPPRESRRAPHGLAVPSFRRDPVEAPRLSLRSIEAKWLGCSSSFFGGLLGKASESLRLCFVFSIETFELNLSPDQVTFIILWRITQTGLNDGEFMVNVKTGSGSLSVINWFRLDLQHISPLWLLLLSVFGIRLIRSRSSAMLKQWASRCT